MARSRKRKKKGKVVKMQKRQATSPEKYIRTKGRTLPIETCWITENWREVGMTDILVVRRHPQGKRTIGIYLVDLYCLGVKDTFFYFSINDFEYEELLKKVNVSEDHQLVEIDYDTVHNIIYGAIEFAEEYEFSPHKDFIKTNQYLLEDAEADIPFIDISFGHDGKPFIIGSPNYSIDHIIRHLDRVAGPDGYHYLDRIDNFEDFGDLDEEFIDEEEMEKTKALLNFMADVVDEIYEEKIGEEPEYNVEDFLPENLQIVFDGNEEEEEETKYWNEITDLVQAKQFEKVESRIKTTLEEKPSDKHYIVLCRAYLAQEKYEEYEATISSAREQFPYSFELSLIGKKENFYKAKREEKEIPEIDVKTWLQDFNEVDDEDFMEMSAFLITYFNEKKEVQKAIAFYTALMEIDPDHPFKLPLLLQIADTQKAILDEKGLVKMEEWTPIFKDRMKVEDDDGEEYHDFEEVED